VKLKSDTDFAPTKRYGHTALLYEPATKETLSNLKSNLRLADIRQRTSTEQADAQSEGEGDTAYMVVFGGKNAEFDNLFNDIYFLGIP